MAKNYALLRGEMRRNQVSQADLAERFGKSIGFISARFTCEKPWPLDMAYEILDLFGHPHDQLHLYFPPGGLESKLKAPARNAMSDHPKRIVIEALEDGRLSLVM